MAALVGSDFEVPLRLLVAINEVEELTQSPLPPATRLALALVEDLGNQAERGGPVLKDFHEFPPSP